MDQRNTNGAGPAPAGRLLSLLRGHGLSLRIREAAALTTRCAAFFLGFVLLVVAFDHALVRGLPRAALVLCALALLATLLAGGVALGHRLSRRYGDRFVAREYERTFGVAHNAVLNWLFVRGDHAVEYASAAGAAQAEAEIVSPHGTIAPSAPPRGQWLWLGGVALAWVLFAAVTPKDIPTSLRRLLGSLEPAPSATRIELSRPRPKDAVYAGQPLTLEFILSGRSSERLAVELLSNGDEGAETLVRHMVVRTTPRGEPDVRTINLAGNEVARDVWLRARAGDGEYRGVIRVLPEPELLSYEIRIEPPAYTQQSPFVLHSPDVSAPVGSNATWRIIANTPIRSPIFVFRPVGETRTRMDVTQVGGREATLSWQLKESGDYWIEFADSWGRMARQRAVHRIVVQADSPPLVELVEPRTSGDASVDLGRSPWLRVAAQDDWQLSSLELVIERQGVLERRDLLGKQTVRAGDSAAVGVPGADVALRVGETVRGWFEAKDNHCNSDGKPAPQVGRSPILSLTRSVESDVVRRGNKSPTETVSAVDGAKSGQASGVKTRERGVGEGDDKSAAGDGSGDVASDKPGEPGGSTRESSQGSNAAETGEKPDPENSARIGQEAGPDEKGGGKGEDGAKEKDEGESDESGDGEAGGSFDQQMKEFIERHGQDAADAQKQLEKPPGERQSAETGTPRERQSTPEQPDASQEEKHQSDQGDPGGEGNESTKPQKRGDKKEPADSKTGTPGEADSKPKEKSDQADPNQEKGDRNPDTPDPEAKGEKEGSPNAPAKDQEKPKDSEPPPNNQENTPSDSASTTGQDAAGARRDEKDALPPADEPTAAGSEDTVPNPAGNLNSPSSAPAQASSDTPKPLPPEAGAAERRPPPEVLNALELMQRLEEQGESAFDDLPWPAEKKAAFLRELKRLSTTAKRTGVLADVKRWRAGGKIGSSEVQRGAGVASELAIQVGGEAMQADFLQKLASPPDQTVAPHLRAVLDAYYRSLAAKRAQQSKRSE